MINNIIEKQVEIIVKDGYFELPQELQNKIKDFWNKCLENNPNLWDGDVMCISECKIEKDIIIMTCQKTKYSHYLYDERVGLPKEYGCNNMAAGSLIETSDHYYVVGELAENMSYPRCMQLPGGNADNSDIKDGKINILDTIIRETREELNINLEDESQVEKFKINYIAMPTEDVHTYVIFAKCSLKMTKEELQNHYDKYVEYLKENNLEIEFGKIHFLKKGETTEQLAALDNPKRNYLVELLEVDNEVNKVYIK